MAQMILGTAQLGFDYGIHNRTGMPSDGQAMDILQTAFEGGIDTLDTAQSYGESEKRIGNYHESSGNQFKICTKLPVELQPEEIEACFRRSLDRMKARKINVCYLHRFEQCSDNRIIRELKKLRDGGYIVNIGISVYQPEEMEFIIKYLSHIVDVIQIPFSMFDHERWTSERLLYRAKQAGLQIYCRSIYLQGLVFLDWGSKVAGEKGISDALRSLGEIASQCGCGVEKLAVAFIQSFPEIDKYLVGSETKQQVLENVAIYKETAHCRLEREILDRITCLSRKVDSKTIDPRTW